MSEKVKIPNDLASFMKKNPTATFNDYLDERIVQSFIKDVEERSCTDSDPFELFIKDLDKVLEKHYPDTDYQWAYPSDSWIELKLWIKHKEASDE